MGERIKSCRLNQIVIFFLIIFFVLHLFKKTTERNVMTVMCHRGSKDDSSGGVDVKFLQCFLQNPKTDFCLIFPYIFASVLFPLSCSQCNLSASHPLMIPCPVSF